MNNLNICIIGLCLVAIVACGSNDKDQNVGETRTGSTSSYSKSSSSPGSASDVRSANASRTTRAVKEPEWKAAVTEVSKFVQRLPEQILRDEHEKIVVTEDSYNVHKKAAQFAIGLSREVELEAMEQQRLHIVQLADRIIATFNQLDHDYAALERRIRDVSWDSAVERNNQLSRLQTYSRLKSNYLEPALAAHKKYNR